MNAKERKTARDKAYYLKNREALLLKQKIYSENNKESIAARQKIDRKKRNNSEGIGVYKAVYPSGVYIGSGQIYMRKAQHRNGNSCIGKTLNEKATSFEVICLTNDIKDARVKEQQVIGWYGLANLLNKRNPKLGE